VQEEDRDEAGGADQLENDILDDMQFVNEQ